MVSILQLLSSEVWYTIGDPFMPRAFEIAASLSNKRRLFHWLGADVDALAREAPLLQKFKSPKFKHLAQNNAVAERLSQLGLPSQVVPLSAVRQVKAIRELPQVLTLLLYVPAGNPDAYGRHHYEQLMRALSYEPLHYIVVGGGPISVPSGVSVEQLGWRHDLGPTYDRSTALLRFDSHDSTSIMVIEALLHGRYVLCSNDFPFTTHVADYDTLERCVRDLLNRHSKRLLMPQAQAAKTMSALHSPTRCLRLLAEVCGCRGTTRPCVPAFESETKELL